MKCQVLRPRSNGAGPVGLQCTYTLPEENGNIQVIVKDETLWCTQKAMAQLFGIGIPAISKHLKNIFDEGELQKEVVISKMETTAAYNLTTHPSTIRMRSSQ